MKTADDWYRKGMAEIDLSRSADTTREYHGDLEDAVMALRPGPAARLRVVAKEAGR